MPVFLLPSHFGSGASVVELCSVLASRLRPCYLPPYLLTQPLTYLQACGKPTVDDLASHRLLASLTLLEPLDTLFVLDR